ncbi:MAG TPA: NosD domain-containing protein [Caldilineaceae bacterium]|mgnify:CR=1 FL=1|nr:NosD domain-containing protein [Caldilineaceae bacterium]
MPSDQFLSEFRDLFNLLIQLFTQLQNLGNLLVLLIPVGIIGFWRWGLWLVRKIVGARYRPLTPSGYTTSTTIVTPVYNEDPQVFRAALDSWLANGPNEIVAVIDYTDESCIQEFRKFEEACAATGVVTTRLIVTRKPGKRAALVEGIQVANGEIVFLVDSDTLWEKDVLVRAIAPFEDPEVGGVTTRQNVLEPRTVAQRLFDLYLDIRYLEEIRFLAATGDALTCLSGRTAVYRRSAILPLLDGLANETFWGQKVIAGDDKRLTHLLQAAGWKVRYQENARVYTPGFPKLRQFSRQRIRWARNSWRADLRAIFSAWLWKHPVLAFYSIDRLFQPLTSLVAPTYLVLSIIHRDWFTTVVILLWWLVSRTVKIWMHLRRRRSSIVILPFYIFFIYINALLRIYAFFTMNHQSWVTRWDQTRVRGLSFARSILSYAATGVMVVFVVLVINVIYNQRMLLANITDPNLISSEQQLPGYNWEEAKAQLVTTLPSLDNVGAKAVAEGTTQYELGVGDTITLLAQKYGVDESAITLTSDTWRIGESVAFQLPFKSYDEYRQTLPPIATAELASQVVYRPEINAITVSGNMTVVDIPTIHSIINNEELLADEGNGVYSLKVNLELKRHTVLLIEGPQVNWLKLQSNQRGAVRIFADSANIGIKQAKITSWDPDLNDVDHEINDGRAHIRVNNGRMDIVRSEIAYLGQPKLRNSGGGVYGLSWRVENSSRFEHELTTGSFEDNDIHDNYMGFYSFGATAMTIRNNRVYNNVEYGLDPHDDSNNFIVENNEVFGNGNHGIIFSRRCVNNIIRNNRSYNNALHGIMLDRESNNNSVYNNYVQGNVDGIALWRSDLNAIYNNQVIENQRGIRLNRRAADNVVYDNQIQGSEQYGVYLYEESRANWFFNNTAQENRVGFYIRSLNNYVFDNTVSGGQSAIYLTPEAAGNQIARNQLTGSETGLYLKTAPDELIADNIFQNNRENIRFTEDWYSGSVTQPGLSYLERFRRYFAVTRLWAQAAVE